MSLYSVTLRELKHFARNPPIKMKKRKKNTFCASAKYKKVDSCESLVEHMENFHENRKRVCQQMATPVNSNRLKCTLNR